jgi:hypothetical protein
MHIRNKQVDVDEAVAGMVLSQAVRDGRGGILLPENTVLTDALLTSLRRRGIDRIDVVNNDLSAEQLHVECERVQRRLVRLFRKCDADRIGALLLQQLTEYRLGEIK